MFAYVLYYLVPISKFEQSFELKITVWLKKFNVTILFNRSVCSCEFDTTYSETSNKFKKNYESKSYALITNIILWFTLVGDMMNYLEHYSSFCVVHEELIM